MNKSRIAIVGSGLSALGALVAIQKLFPKANIDILSQPPSGKRTAKHKALWHRSFPSWEYGVHIVKRMIDDVALTNGVEPLIDAVSYPIFGGSSNVWGGACHPLLSYEMDSFDTSIFDGYAAIIKALGYSNDYTSHMCNIIEVKPGVNFTRTLTLGTRDGEYEYKAESSASYISNTSSNLIFGRVKNVLEENNRVKVDVETMQGGQTTYNYDYVIMAAGVVGTTSLLASYHQRPLTLTHSTNEQYLFFARFRRKFSNEHYGPPSLLVDKLGEYPAYIQLYPINPNFISSNGALLTSAIDSAPAGFMAGYLYIDSRASSKYSVTSSVEGVYKAQVSKNGRIKAADFASLKESLVDLGISIIGNPLKLFPTSSQHIGGGLYNNCGGGPVASNRLVVVDTSSFKHVPLCTIGLTAAANAFCITKEFFK